MLIVLDVFAYIFLCLLRRLCCCCFCLCFYWFCCCCFRCWRCHCVQALLLLQLLINIKTHCNVAKMTCVCNVSVAALCNCITVCVLCMYCTRTYTQLRTHICKSLFSRQLLLLLATSSVLHSRTDWLYNLIKITQPTLKSLLIKRQF